MTGHSNITGLLGSVVRPTPDAITKTVATLKVVKNVLPAKKDYWTVSKKEMTVNVLVKGINKIKVFAVIEV